MKLGREVSRHNELDNWRNTHRFESVMAPKWLLLTISETEPGLWDRLRWDANKRAELREKLETWRWTVHPCPHCQRPLSLTYADGRREKYCERTWGFLSKKKPCPGYLLEYTG